VIADAEHRPTACSRNHCSRLCDVQSRKLDVCGHPVLVWSMRRRSGLRRPSSRTRQCRRAFAAHAARSVWRRLSGTHAVRKAACGVRNARADDKRGAHILRHAFCSPLAMPRAPAKAFQELAGDQDLKTTQRYVHLSPLAFEGAIRLLCAPRTGTAFRSVLATGPSPATSIGRTGWMIEAAGVARPGGEAAG
jgi:hypothetical protein